MIRGTVFILPSGLRDKTLNWPDAIPVGPDSPILDHILGQCENDYK